MTRLVAMQLLVVLAAVPGDVAASRTDGARRVPIVRLAGSLQNPCFSPDSKRLVITQWLDGYNKGRAEVQLVRLKGGAALARISPRQSQMVESRFFGGLDVPETAALLDVSEATVLRDWRAAKAWLSRELRSGG